MSSRVFPVIINSSRSRCPTTYCPVHICRYRSREGKRAPDRLVRHPHRQDSLGSSLVHLIYSFVMYNENCFENHISSVLPCATLLPASVYPFESAAKQPGNTQLFVNPTLLPVALRCSVEVWSGLIGTCVRFHLAINNQSSNKSHRASKSAFTNAIIMQTTTCYAVDISSTVCVNRGRTTMPIKITF